MEEQQVRQFLTRTTQDEAFRQRVMENPEVVLQEEGYSEKVTGVIARLVPHLAFDGQRSSASFSWWW